MMGGGRNESFFVSGQRPRATHVRFILVERGDTG